MKVLDATTRRAVQDVIDAHRSELTRVPGFVDVEPGFPIVNGAVLKEPAIIVFVARKKPPTHLLPEERMPRQFGPYRVAVMQASPMRQIQTLMDDAPIAARLDDASTGLTYEGLPNDPIDRVFTVSQQMLCHVGPDCGWPVLKQFLENTQRKLSVAMYDFNAAYIAKTFVETVRDNDIGVTLTWDDGMTKPETEIREKLRAALGDSLDGWIVRCGGGRRFASAYHEKVAVRDSKAFWLSSGNWSLRSQPEIDPVGTPSQAKGMYSKGNREWHVVVQDSRLAKVFERYIQHDRNGSQAESEAEAGGPGTELDEAASAMNARLPDLFVAADALLDFEADDSSPVAPQVLPRVARKIQVQPVLTPDNYLAHIKALLSGAERSVYLQFAYINFSEKAADKDFTDLLKILADLSNRPDMDVRIIVGSTEAADKIRKLAQNGFNPGVFRSQRNVHNKGIIVDAKKVLVSSTNWSGDGVLRNRDAGLIVTDDEIAGYYQSVFLADWENRATSYIDDDPAVMVAEDGAQTPPGMVRVSWREYFGG